MNRLNAPSPHALYRVGGRLYKTTGLTPTSLRLEDLLDGHCLLFTRDQAWQMIQQQDLIKVKHSTYRRLCQLDPRYRPYLPAGAPLDDHEPLTGPAVQRTATTPWPPMNPREAPADSGPWRNGAEERELRCTRLFQGLNDGLAHHPAERVRVLIVDEFSCYHGYSSVILAEIQALFEHYAQMQMLKPDPGRGAIRTRTQHRLPAETMTASEDRWLAKRQVRPAPTAPSGPRLKTLPSMMGSPALTVAPCAIARLRPTQPEQQPAGARPPYVIGAALDRIELPSAQAGSRIPLPPVGGKDDVE